MTIRLRWTVALCVIALAAVSASALAGSKPAVNLSRGQLALRGHDAVAYITVGRPVRGATDLEYRWNGAVWRFSTAANRNMLAKDPTRYAPEFGG